MARRTVWISLGVLALSGALAAAYASGRPASARSDSPLAAYPGFGHHPRAEEERFKAEERRREELIASCMGEHGFDYVPEPSLESDSSVMPDEAGPNERYVGSLSPQRRRAYWLALEGTADPGDQSGFSSSGCLHDAHAAIPGVYAAVNALRGPYDELQHAIASDPRIVEAERRWSSCMRSAGYSYSSPRELVAAGDSASPPASYDAAVAAGASCRRDVDLAGTYADVTVEHETRFVERYRTVLEQYR